MEGLASEMYRGTRAEARPMPKPVMARPASMMVRLPARADSRGPRNRGMESSRKALRRPRLSARLCAVRLPTAAPASTVLTTCRPEGA